MDNALRGEYSPDGNKILFYSKQPDGKYDIYYSDSNGNNRYCLTCSISAFNGLNVGGGSWHPSMKYIAFQAEKSEHIVHPGSESLTHPGIGWYSDIYVMRLSDQKLLKVTNLPTKTNVLDSKPLTAVLHPHFSKDGKKISWGQSPNLTVSGWKNWEIAMADFIHNENEFRVKNIVTLKPKNINGYYESDDFSSNAKKLLISGNLEPKQKPIAMDVYEYNLINKSLKRLTKSEYWDESPIYSPDNTKIAWLSSQGFRFTLGSSWWENGRTEIWVMHANGLNKRKVTFFNTSGSSDYDLVKGKRVIAHYVEWHPSGKTMIVSIAISNDPLPGFTEKIALVEIQ